MTLGIIAAMKIEAEMIIREMEGASTETVGGVTFTKGKLGKIDAVLSVCGIGKVFAAMCAQTMIVKYSPDAIINTGVGGTLTKSLSVGDIAISKAVVQHDMDTSPLGDPVGLISGINVIEIAADAALVSAITSAADELGLHSVCGTIASGDRFIADVASKKYITDNFGAVACEMEGAAVGQVCYVNNVPFAVIRAISDDADNGACEDYPAFAANAAKNTASIVVSIANSL